MSDMGGTAHEEGLRVLVEDLASPEAGLTPRGNYFQRSEVKAALVGGCSPQAQFTAHPEHARRTDRAADLRDGPAAHRHDRAAPAAARGPDGAGPGDVADPVPAAAAAARDVGGRPDLPGHAGRRSPRTTWRARSSWASTTWMRPRSRSAGGCCGRPASPTPTSRWPTCRATRRGCNEQDWTDAYARHKENLQLVGLNDPEKRWVLKNPSHMTALDALMAVYPDALIVYTHRDPVVCIASSCSLSAETTVGQLRDVRRRRHRPHPARPVVARRSTRSGTRGRSTTRRSSPTSRSRTCATTRSASPAAIYDQFGLDWTPEVQAAIEEIDREAKTGHAAPTHTYYAQGLRADRAAGARGLRPIGAAR